MERIYNILVAVLVAVAFTAGCLVGRRSVRPIVETVEQIRIDTIFYERPVAAAVTRRPATIRVPRMLFAERLQDTVRMQPVERAAETAEVTTADSVSVEVSVETRIYEDSLYRAQVSGPVVGPLGPSLDWINFYNSTRTITQTRRPRFAVTAGVNISYTDRGIKPAGGIQVGVILWSF